MLPVRKRDRLLSDAHRRAPKQEKELAQRLGARTVKGSGAGNEKGDVRITGVARIEAKCTTRASFSITRAMIDKIEEAALACGEVPAIHVEFVDDRGNVTHECAVVPSYVLKSLVREPA